GGDLPRDADRRRGIPEAGRLEADLARLRRRSALRAHAGRRGPHRLDAEPQPPGPDPGPGQVGRAVLPGAGVRRRLEPGAGATPCAEGPPQVPVAAGAVRRVIAVPRAELRPSA